MSNPDLYLGLDVSRLTEAQRGYFARWMLGEDLRRSLERSTFYRIRSEIEVRSLVDIARPFWRGDFAPDFSADPFHGIDVSMLTEAQTGYVARWMLGDHLLGALGRSTFWRIRRQIEAGAGMDIARPYRRGDTADRLYIDDEGTFMDRRAR